MNNSFLGGLDICVEMVGNKKHETRTYRNCGWYIMCFLLGKIFLIGNLRKMQSFSCTVYIKEYTHRGFIPPSDTTETRDFPTSVFYLGFLPVYQ